MNYTKIDRVLGALMRLCFAAIIIVMCINVNDAFAQEVRYSWTLTISVTELESGATETAMQLDTGNEAECLFAMGYSSHELMQSDGSEVSEGLTDMGTGYYTVILNNGVAALITCTTGGDDSV